MEVEHINDGYHYVIDKQQGGVTYLVCKYNRFSHCHGRGINRGNRFEETNPHNHAPEENAELIAIFKRELRLASVAQFDTPKTIYDSLRILHPEAAVLVTYASIESSMRRWRKASHPPMPESLTAYSNLLDDPRWGRTLAYNLGRLEATSLFAADHSISVVFGNRNFIDLISDTTEIFVDATFTVVPAIAGAYQLLTIMATKFDHALPFIWALMRRVLAPNLQPTSFMADYEKALQNSMRDTYRDAAQHGCFFHYCQALWRKARNLHVTEGVADNEEGQKVLRKIMALALLPSEDIQESVDQIYNTASEEIRGIFVISFQYFQHQWLNRVTPELFSVYGLIRRTNNSVESYHRVLLTKMAPHPNIWDFTKKLVNIQSAAHTDLLALQQGRSASRSPKVGYVLNNRQILRAWEKLVEGRLTTAEFVEQASYFVSILARNFGQAAVAADNEMADEPELVEGIPLPEVRNHNNQAEAPVPDVLIPAVPDIIVPAHPLPDAPVIPDNAREMNDAIVLAHDDEQDNAEEPVPRRRIPTPNLPEDQIEQDTRCAVCRDNQSCYLCVPCYHLVLCGRCANQILRTAREYGDGENPLFGHLRCPWCNQDAAEFRRVHMPIA